MYDIAIIGGGPAGATLARLLGKEYRVLLLEKRTFDADMPFSCEKCCGGLIDPDGQQMLARFGLGIPKSVILSPQLFAVRTIDITNSIERYYQRHYINIDRNAFDYWLESIVPHSVDIRNGCIFKGFSLDGESTKIRYNYRGRDYEDKAKLLVGADGALSMVRRLGFPNMPFPKLYISIQEWFESEHNNLNFYGAVFDEEITDFYSWTIPKENQLILGAALRPGPDVHEKFRLLKQKLSRYGYDFSKSIGRNGAYLLRPEKMSQICPGSGPIALIGEAAGFISPSSAEGLSYAFKSSLALAKALSDGLEGYDTRYRRNIGSLKRNIFLKNLKKPAMYNGFLRKLAMKSRLMSINIEK